MDHKFPKIIFVCFLLFILWSFLFIFRSSVVAFDGKRYFSLFDDAMISMRYAWNFSHGHGLVWNFGEKVEGYSNPLMVLFMSLFAVAFDKSTAVFAVQIFGGALIIICCIIFLRLLGFFVLRFPNKMKILLYIAGLIAVITYYPLLYWTLTGMETGLLCLLLLITLMYLELFLSSKKNFYLYLVVLFQGLAYLTRPDALLYSIPIFIYIIVTCNFMLENKSRLLTLGACFCLFLFFVAGLEIFRVSYYGELLPNTYILKMTGMPFADRIRNGLGFIRPYIETHFFVLFISFVGYHLIPSPRKSLYTILIFISVLYQIWVGGDPWPYWRLLTPVQPLLILLFLSSVMFLLEGSSLISKFYSKGWAFYSVVLIGILLINYPFIGQLFLIDRPYLTEYYDLKINSALAINDVTSLEATVGVFSAGTIPYYADRYSIDFLGKMDKHIAMLPPDLSGNISWAGMYSVPGHNKYDLDYSIKQLLPTYIQYPNWRGDDITDWAKKNYVLVKYKGISLWLRRDSTDVNWKILDLP